MLQITAGTITVTAERTTDVTATLTLITGSISVTSIPAGANIFLDGTSTGTITPSTLTGITPGDHTIMLTKAGYYDWTGTVTVMAGSSTSLSVSLIDAIAPDFAITVSGIGTLTITVTPNEVLKVTPSLRIKDSTNATITTTFIGYANGTYTWQATITPACADGTATIMIKGTDTAGNPGSGTRTFQISIPRKLEPATGTPQMATVSTTLQPFVVQLTDSLNRPIQGQTIKWTLVSAPATASLLATLTSTNVEGLASITMTLGTKTGNYIVIAEGSSLRATFTAVATAGVLTHINISPTEPSITVNQPFSWTANGYDQYNNEIAGLTYNWAIEGDIGSLTLDSGTSTILLATSTPAVGTVSVGTLGVTGRTRVSVVFGELTSVTINSATTTVEMLGSQSFTAQAINQYNFPMGAIYTWTLKSTGIGTLNTTISQAVVFTATKTGTVDLQVVAAFGTRTATATIKITVINGVVHHINITPATATIEARGTASVTARAYNQHDYELSDIVNFGWQIAEGSGTMSGGSGKTVTVQANDVVATLTLTAYTGTITGTAAVTVIHGSVSGVSIFPAIAEVNVMGSRTFAASAVNRFGHSIPASELSYAWGLSGIDGSITSTNDTIAFIAGSKTGTVYITVMGSGKTATTTVTVKPGAIARLVFVQPTAGTLTVGMSGTMTIQTQDEYGNVSPATSSTIIVSGDDQSRFVGASSGAIWTTSGTFTIAGTSSLTFFYKQNGTTTPIIMAAIGTSISATHTVAIELLGSSSSGAVVADDGKTRVEIDTGVITGAGGYIEIDTSGTSTANIVLGANVNDNADTTIDRIEGTLRRFEIHDATITTTAMAKMRIFIPYHDVNPDDGFVDGTQIREDRLEIYTAVGTGADARWQPVEHSWVDPVHNIVYALVPHFSYYILMGSGFEPTPEKAIAYPNPYEASKHTCIYFDKLTENSTIKIFTIAGELVREIRVESSPQRWDVRNSAGEKVASGIYIYLIKDPAGNKKVGKLGVLR